MADFDSIKNNIKKYRLNSLIPLCLSLLNKIQLERNTRYPYWNIFALIKWSFLHSDNNILRRNANLNSLGEILEQINNLELSHPELKFSNYSEVNKSFRIIAYQQFSLQEKYHISLIDRQIVLYEELNTKVNLSNEFYRLTGMMVIDFLKYCQLTHIYLFGDLYNPRLQYNGKLNADYFEIFTAIFSKEALHLFLELLSIKNVGEFSELQKMSNPVYQLYETNLFVTKPFLLFRGEYYIIYRQAFIQTIKQFTYTFLKPKVTQFPEEFGKRLEKYIELGIKELNIQYLNESGLKRRYSEIAIADYYINNNTIIECKATEMQPRSGVLRLPNVLSKEFDHSITKAYCQMLSTANAINPNQEWYGIIITYNDLFLGFGFDAWLEFLKTPVEQFCNEKSIHVALLPPENLFFIDIADWDYLVQVIKDRIATWDEIYKKAKETNVDSNMLTRKFSFDMVLKVV